MLNQQRALLLIWKTQSSVHTLHRSVCTFVCGWNRVCTFLHMQTFSKSGPVTPKLTLRWPDTPDFWGQSLFWMTCLQEKLSPGNVPVLTVKKTQSEIEETKLTLFIRAEEDKSTLLMKMPIFYSCLKATHPDNFTHGHTSSFPEQSTCHVWSWSDVRFSRYAKFYCSDY